MKSNQKKNTQQGMEQYFFRVSANKFHKIPGSPIAYWASENISESFEIDTPLSDLIDIRAGMSTTDNQLFLRQWFEVNFKDIATSCEIKEEAIKSRCRWFPYIKGGSFRRWFGNNDFVVNWKNDGEDIKNYIAERPEKQVGGRLVNMDCFFKQCLAWTRISSSNFSARFYPAGSIFSDASNGGFGEVNNIQRALLLLNTKIISRILSIISPTINFYAGDIGKLPSKISHGNVNIFDRLFRYSQRDWNSYETSWDFVNLPILEPRFWQPSLKVTYKKVRSDWREVTLETQRLEEDNNSVFINAYGLQGELTPDVALQDVTLTCNPHYRYGGDKTEEKLEALLLADTMREFISYAVGCMFGRCSLDKPGLVLANQGETLAHYLLQVPEPRFTPDKDNVIPLLDGDWFADDITERFRQFLRITFGEEHYEENLDFIEHAIGKDIRKFFLRDFYTDHVKRYKKRPIYWLFSSPKGTFNALIYLHRYRPDTASVVLQYLREFRNKLAARLDHLQQVSISASASQVEKTRALKEIDVLKKQLLELDDYERDTLYPLATKQIALDLDDGVKVNYPKFGAALKKIPGMEAKDED